VVPRAEAPGWRKTHIGHPTYMRAKHLDFLLVLGELWNVSIQALGWLLGG
jgi:hypothetical protein